VVQRAWKWRQILWPYLHRINPRYIQEVYSKIRVWNLHLHCYLIRECNYLHWIASVYGPAWLQSARGVFFFEMPLWNSSGLLFLLGVNYVSVCIYFFFCIFEILHWPWCLFIADINLLLQQKTYCSSVPFNSSAESLQKLKSCTKYSCVYFVKNSA
jgi:hypothetical protein